MTMNWSEIKRMECMKLWRQVYVAEIARDGTDHQARQAANQAVADFRHVFE